MYVNFVDICHRLLLFDLFVSLTCMLFLSVDFISNITLMSSTVTLLFIVFLQKRRRESIQMRTLKKRKPLPADPVAILGTWDELERL